MKTCRPHPKGAPNEYLLAKLEAASFRRYIARHDAFFSRLAVDEPLTEGQNILGAQATAILEQTRELAIALQGAWTVLENRDQVGLPGYLVMPYQGKDGIHYDAGDRQFLDIWSLPDIEEWPAYLRAAMAKCNEQRLAKNEATTSIAIWVTGIFSPDLPIHILAVSPEDHVGLIQNGAVQQGVAGHHMHLLLKLLKTQAVASAARGRVGAVPQDSQVIAALQGISQVVTLLGGKLGSLLKVNQSLVEGIERDLASQKQTLQARADERRKAAVEAKNKELATANARILELTRQLSCAQVALKQSASTTKAAAPLQATHATQPEIQAPVSVVDEWADHWRHTAEHQAASLRELRVVIQHLQEAQARNKDAPADPAPPAPRKFEDIATWADENADRVVVLSRASQAARKAVYEDPEFVFKSLDLLATTYRDVKLGLLDRMAYAKAAEALGLSMGGSVDVQVSADYFFDWKGRRRFLDQHIGRGSSRDPRYCFRAYFTWDAEEAKVIIGWLPSHLPTRTT